ncbi:MAG TPA: hypothetical protein VN734_13300 [Acidobacteriaceae bacterium]|nr:hypothetical protein [Acidobacteriaceae bacterium]
MAATLVGPVNVSPGLPGGNRAALNVTVSTVIKATSGICVSVAVVVAGSTAGTVNDVASTGGATAANQFGTIPDVVGTYQFNWPCGTGITVIPGTGQTLAVSFA